MIHPTHGRLLRPGEVARLFHISVKTVERWTRAGRLPYILTPGGHRRFPEQAILALRDRYATHHHPADQEVGA